MRRASPWLIPAGLMLLSVIPAIGGFVRLSHLRGPIAPDDVRFAAAPTLVVVHIVGSLFYAFLGALQFSPAVLRWSTAWHRNVGKVLVACGLAVALSGIWMTLSYPITKPEGLPSFDGVGVFATRLVVGAAMAWFIVEGYRAIRRRDIPRHKAMMMRGYALGLGAGTQVLTHIPWALFPSIRGEFARTLFMAAGWGINLAVAEWLIARKRPRGVSRVSA